MKMLGAFQQWGFKVYLEFPDGRMLNVTGAVRVWVSRPSKGYAGGRVTCAVRSVGSPAGSEEVFLDEVMDG